MNNSKENIKQLLEKYWSGESSLEEEKTLTSYFSMGQVDDEFKPFTPLFSYFAEQRQISVDLEDQIMSRIANTENKGKVINLTWRRVVAIAASLLLVFSVTTAIFQYRQNQKQDLAMSDTFQSPEEALEQTKAALLYLSKRMNKASAQATKSLSKTQNLNILN